MKIEINLKIILFIILFFLLNSINTYLIFLIFVIIHELAHFICGICIGGIPRKLYLNPLGVSIEFYFYRKKNFLSKILFYFSGPLINFLIAIICYYIKIDESLKIIIIYTNLALGIFNLLPILPLDGGKIFKEILKKYFNGECANKVTIICSKTILVVITFLYSLLILKVKNIYIVFLLGYLWYLYFLEEKKYQLFKRVAESIKSISRT